MFAAKATARGVACSGDAREASGNAGAGLMGGIWSARGNSAPGSAGRAGVRFAVALAEAGLRRRFRPGRLPACPADALVSAIVLQIRLCFPDAG